MSAPIVELPYRCKHCGTSSVAWLPQCAQCRYFNSLVSEQDDRIIRSTDPRVPTDHERWPTGVPIFDAVLLGGLVRHSIVILGGIAGAGKSTLLSMVAGGLAASGKRILYVCAEEEIQAVVTRGKRTGSLHDRLDLIRTVDAGLAMRMGREYDAVIFDSIQSLGVLAKDIVAPKTRVLVTQLNKEGDIHGERGNEHNPDTILFCDYDPQTEKRQLLSTKNRHGALKAAPYLLTDLGVVGMPCDVCGEVVKPCPCGPKKRKKRKEGTA